MTRPAPTVDQEQLARCLPLLGSYYGPRRWRGRRDPLDELIMTILSQNTTDRNSGRAFRALKQQFPDWHAVIDAPTDQVYAAIRPAGLGNVKAPRIQATLRAIQERTGQLSLDLLDTMPTDEARAWLLSLEGTGPKTAACVLMFALGRPALPVDTHVHRVAQRLALIGPKVSADRAHTLLEAALAPDQVYAFHVNLIQHGRLICHARQPECGRCPLQAICPSSTTESPTDQTDN